MSTFSDNSITICFFELLQIVDIQHTEKNKVVNKLKVFIVTPYTQPKSF